MKLKLIGTGAITGKERSACSLIDGRILIDCGNGFDKKIVATHMSKQARELA